MQAHICQNTLVRSFKGSDLELYKRTCVPLRVIKKNPLHKPDYCYLLAQSISFVVMMCAVIFTFHIPHSVNNCSTVFPYFYCLLELI